MRACECAVPVLVCVGHGATPSLAKASVHGGQGSPIVWASTPTAVCAHSSIHDEIHVRITGLPLHDSLRQLRVNALRGSLSPGVLLVSPWSSPATGSGAGRQAWSQHGGRMRSALSERAALVPVVPIGAPPGGALLKQNIISCACPANHVTQPQRPRSPLATRLQRRISATPN